MLFKTKKLFTFATKTRNCYKVMNKSPPKLQPEDNPLLKQLQSRIKIAGPISVADYMKEVLINPFGGYYMHKDVFGQSGDFVTSPELGQLFGEMIAIWFLNEWSKLGCPKPFQLVELGPGRGTLCEDILRVFERFGTLEKGSVHLVEASPHLSDLQARRLCLNTHATSNELYYQHGLTIQGLPIRWYKHLSGVPKGAFTLLVAHEFFDALPIHKLQKTKDGWREILVDLDTSSTNDIKFRNIISREETPAVKLFVDPSETREHFEISPDSLVLMHEIAERLKEDGGLALIGDYGHEGTGTDTFRAFKKHKLHDPLVEPGTADLTADVDFSALKLSATKGDGVVAFGPVAQKDFLLRMGIEERLKILEEGASKKQKESLQFGYKMMTDSDQMGTRFKFLSLYPAVVKDFMQKFPSVGFH